MELEHRFELPVGIATAWAALTDITTMGPCFPGATVADCDADADAAGGTSFSGSVKIKLGRGPWIYRGRGTLEEQDALTHRARVEASGTAAHGASTAAMLVTLTATAITESRTAVELLTTLSITGRPSRFGRDVMVEKSNDLVSQFADNLSEVLTGRPAGGAELVDVVDPDQVAADIVSEAAQEQVVGSGQGEPGTGRPPAAHRYSDGDHPDALDQPAGVPLLRRVIPIALAVTGVLLLRKLFSSKADDDDADDRDASDDAFDLGDQATDTDEQD